MAVFNVMDHTGHTPFEFDPKNSAEVAAAEKRFMELVAEGRTPAVRTEKGEAKVTRVFDPAAEETLFWPQLRGG